MNKDSIYKLIGYNGEYNANIKRSIRKLLKENHPDNGGDRRIFELINEVKDELENNKVSYKYQDNVVNKDVNGDIDYSFCFEMISTIKKEKKICLANLKEINDMLYKYIDEYKTDYRENIDIETYLLSNSNLVTKLNKIKATYITLLIVAIIVFITSIWKQSILLFIIFVTLSIICILAINKSFMVMSTINKNNTDRFKNYAHINKKLRDNKKKQEQLKKEINKINKKVNNYENDLRFYNNILKNRGL